MEPDRPMKARAGILALLSIAPLLLGGEAAWADWLVYNGGTVVETEGNWTQKGRSVVFTAPGGTLQMVRTEELDLPASRFLASQKRGSWRAAGQLPAGVSFATTAPAAPCSSARVIEAVDGDTLKVEIGGKDAVVRLACVDAAELRHGEAPVQYFGSQAKTFTAAATAGKSICLAQDAKQGAKDRYGRLIAYATLPDGKDLGAALIASGLAVVWRSGSCIRLPGYDKLETEASRYGLGLWGQRPLPGLSGLIGRGSATLAAGQAGDGSGPTVNVVDAANANRAAGNAVDPSARPKPGANTRPKPKPKPPAR
jgi:micrococcal nuclease